jgi:hypothetical protein
LDRPAITFTVRATITVLKPKASRLCSKVILLSLREEMDISETWKVIPITKE